MGLAAGGNFVAAVAGGLIAAVASGVIGWRGRPEPEVAVAFAGLTAVLAIATVVVTFLAVVAVACRDTGFDRC